MGLMGVCDECGQGGFSAAGGWVEVSGGMGTDLWEEGKGRDQGDKNDERDEMRGRNG